METRQPLIIVGMHRSGTTMVAELLSKMGLFVGNDLDRYSESRLFIKLNNWLLQLAGACWDYPENANTLLANEEQRSVATEYLANTLETPYVTQYLGWKDYYSGERLMNIKRAWGWKDPRNTVNLPVWLDIFPGARLVHVRRHGVDVAQSLLHRNQQSLERIKRKLREKKHAPKYEAGKELSLRGLFDSSRCDTLMNCFELWEEYNAFAEKNLAACGNVRHEFRYEDFLERPEEYMAELARFAGLDVTQERLSSLVSHINSDRAYAYRSAPDLAAFSDQVADRLSRYGY